MKITKTIFYKNYQKNKNIINRYIKNFDLDKKGVLKKGRNTIKILSISENELVNNNKIVIKSFKIPNILNRIIYTFFRKSKAQRSFDNAKLLMKFKIGTAKPIAYYETKKYFLIYKSYYVCEHIDYQLTFRDLTINSKYPDKEKIITSFTSFTYKLHENNINFLDHSPGNTLIVKKNNSYNFYLIDLNRMKFERMGFNKRMKNFSRLTTDNKIIKIFSEEYSKKINYNKNEIFKKILYHVNNFQKKIIKKKKIKQLLRIK